MSDVMANQPRMDASAAKPQPGNVPQSTAKGAHGTAEDAQDAHPVQVAVKSSIEESLLPPSVVAPNLNSSTHAKLENGSSEGTRIKPGLDKSKAGAAQENPPANRKPVDIVSGGKTQLRKDDASPSGGSPQDGPAAGSAPAKAPEPPNAFSVAGIQVSTNSVDGKNGNAVVIQNGSGQQPSQVEQKSTGVAHSQAQGESALPYPTPVVHTAKLVERMGETELRLGIRAGEFGSVDVRTSMVRNQFTAEISTARGELGRALAAELPGLQSRLTEQRVPVGNITVQNHAGSQSGLSEHQKPRQEQMVYPTSSGSVREERPIPGLVALEATAEGSRLDIRM